MGAMFRNRRLGVEREDRGSSTGAEFVDDSLHALLNCIRMAIFEHSDNPICQETLCGNLVFQQPV
jgi:hypothetical protein